MSIITDVAGLAKSRVNRYFVENKLIDQLRNSIGPEGIVGAPNMKTQRDEIAKRVRSGDFRGARSYTNDQRRKVQSQPKRVPRY